jgi:hypothetical protein
MEMEMERCAFTPYLSAWIAGFTEYASTFALFHVCPLNKRTGMSRRIQVIRIGLGLVEQGEAEATFATPIGRWRPT